MLCRCRGLINYTRHKKVTQNLRQFFSSFHNLNLLFNKPQTAFAFSTGPFQSQQNTKEEAVLTPQIVRATLHNCPSDLIALSFFLWCGKQPHYFHDRPTFGFMVNVVSRLKQRFSTVEGILRELELVGCATRPQTLLLLLRIYWFGGVHDMVFQTVEEMIKCGYTPNTFVRNIVMDVLFKIERVDVALTVLKETRLPNFLSFSIAICNLCKLNDLSNVQNVLRSMLRKGFYLNPETLSMVLSCFCRSGRLMVALQLLCLMITLGVPVSVHVWSILIDGFCRAGRLDFATNLLDKMVKSGCRPNVVTCTSLIKGFLEAKMPDKAFSVITTMESNKCYPDLVLCNVLIDCFSKMGRYADAFDVFYGWQKRGLVPDAFTLCTIISTVCLSRQFALLPLVTEGIPVEPDLALCNSFLNYFVKAGYPAGSVEFYSDVLNRGFVPDKYTYSGLLNGLCRSGRTGDAINVYYGMVRNNLCRDAHITTIIISGLIRSGYYHRAVKLFRQAAAENLPLDAVSYNVAIDGLLRGCRSSEAYYLFSHMKQVGVVPNVRTYNLMLSSFCKNQNFKMIKQILKEMVDTGTGLDSSTFELMRKFLYISGHSQAALNLFLEFCNSELLSKEVAGAVDQFVEMLAIPPVSSVDTVDIGLSSQEGISGIAVSVG